MAEPISQVVASMPRARFVALMALFLGPAVAVYTLFSIYPLIATMGTPFWPHVSQVPRTAHSFM